MLVKPNSALINLLQPMYMFELVNPGEYEDTPNELPIRETI